MFVFPCQVCLKGLVGRWDSTTQALLSQGFLRTLMWKSENLGPAIFHFLSLNYFIHNVWLIMPSYTTSMRMTMHTKPDKKHKT